MLAVYLTQSYIVRQKMTNTDAVRKSASFVGLNGEKNGANLP